MRWGLAVLTLLVVGYVCRRILHIDDPSSRRRNSLSPEREEIYQPLVFVIETQTGILGVALNEALGERRSGDDENAWRLVRLAACQWERVVEITVAILNAIADNLTYARPVVSAHTMNTSRFRSRAMIDFVGLQEALDASVFRSKIRYQIHIRVLRRAVETLTQEFRNHFRVAEKMQESRIEMWANLDPAFHDFDYITKQVLLAFRGFLPALPDSALAGLLADLKCITEPGARSRPVATPPSPQV
ncbi:MAG: hypothetical protein ACRD2B_16315 [Terriglobia bacterium]